MVLFYECNNNSIRLEEEEKSGFRASESYRVRPRQKDSICQKPVLQVRFFSKQTTFSGALFFCKAIGGESITPNSLVLGQEIVKTFLEDPSNKCAYLKNLYNIWTGLTDKDNEGIFSYGNHNYEALESWSKGQPNGKQFQNCAEMRISGDEAGTLNDEFCENYSICFWKHIL